MGKPLVTILTAAAVGVLVEEAKAMLPWLSDKVLRMAIWLLPGCRRERYREEWASDFTDVPGPISKLAFAFCLPFGAIKIRYYLWNSSRQVKRTVSPQVSLYRLALFVLVALSIRVRLRKIIEWMGFGRPRTKVLGIDYEVLVAFVLVAIVCLCQMQPKLQNE